MEGKAALLRRIKGELIFDPICGVRPPENGLMAKGVLLLRPTELRELRGWARAYATRAISRMDSGQNQGVAFLINSS